MKTRNIGLIVIAATLMAGSAYANGAKGGGLDLQNLSGKRPLLIEKAAEKLMTCSMCASEHKVVSVRDNKGRVIHAVPTVTHGCPSCRTTTSLVGHGKAKVEKRTHACAASGEILACCAK